MNEDKNYTPAEGQTPAPSKKPLPPRIAAPVTPPLPPVTVMVKKEANKTNLWHWLVALGIVGTIYFALSQPLRPINYTLWNTFRDASYGAILASIRHNAILVLLLFIALQFKLSTRKSLIIASVLLLSLVAYDTLKPKTQAARKSNF